MGTLGYLSSGLFYNIMMVSWFEEIIILHPSWNLTNNLFFPELPCTKPVNSFLVLLKHTALTSISNSPIFDLTTIPTTVLLEPPPNIFFCEGREAWEEAVKFEVIMVSWAYRRAERLKRLFDFLCGLSKQNSKPQKQDCMQTYFLLTIDNSVRQLSSITKY